MVHVAHRLDMGVDPAVDAIDFAQRLGGKIDVDRRGAVAVAFAFIALAEIDPAVGHAGLFADRRIARFDRTRRWSAAPRPSSRRKPRLAAAPVRIKPEIIVVPCYSPGMTIGTAVFQRPK